MTATSRGTYTEGNAIPAITTATLHAYSDVDRFFFEVVESSSPFDWTMVFTAALTSVAGSHTLCVYYDRGCDGGVDETRCTVGSGALNVATPDVDVGDSGDDGGCVDVTVTGDWSCSPYRLDLTLD